MPAWQPHSQAGSQKARSRARARAASRSSGPADGRPPRIADFFVATPGLGLPEDAGRRDARDRRRLRRRQRDDPGLPDRRGLLRRARARRPASRPSTRRTAACPGRSCSSPRSSWRATGVVLLAAAGAPARDPRPDPPARVGGTASLQPCRRLAHAAGRRAAAARPRRDAVSASPRREPTSSIAATWRARPPGPSPQAAAKLTADDLAAYRVVWRRPVRVSLSRARGDLEPAAVVGRHPDRVRARAARARPRRRAGNRGGARLARRGDARADARTRRAVRDAAASRRARAAAARRRAARGSSPADRGVAGRDVRSTRPQAARRTSPRSTSRETPRRSPRRPARAPA